MMIPTHVKGGYFAIGIALFLGLAGCTAGKGWDDGSGDATLIAPRVKVGFAQAGGPTQHCSATLRYWFEGQEVTPAVPDTLDKWYTHFDGIEPSAFIPQGGGAAAWHCVYSTVAHALPHEGYTGNFHYEVLSLADQVDDVWDPSFIKLYWGECYLEHLLDSDSSPITSLAANFVNFTTGVPDCVISTNTLAGFPGDS